MMDKITVVIFTHNEEVNIGEAITSSFNLTHEVIVVDMQSTDKTAFIAKKLKTKVVTFPHLFYVEPAREFGIKQSSTDWVFILDADERITKKLANEIKIQIANHQSPITYFKVPRKNIFAGRTWLRHGGWWPDSQMRLINKKYFVSWPNRIHATPIINGELGFLNNPIEHLFHGDINTMVKKTAIFEDIESDLLYEAGRSASTSTFFRKYLAELWRRMFKKFGFLDGSIGIIESIYQAFSKTITYLFLYEKNNESRSL